MAAIVNGIQVVFGALMQYQVNSHPLTSIVGVFLAIDSKMWTPC